MYTRESDRNTTNEIIKKTFLESKAMNDFINQTKSKQDN